jgi:hypothetical protein
LLHTNKYIEESVSNKLNDMSNEISLLKKENKLINILQENITKEVDKELKIKR